MAEQQNNVFNKGLHLDSRELHQPEGTYRFALNAINEGDNGSNINSIINESGNYECLNLPTGSYPVGSILLADSEIILFLKNPDSIILADLKTCSYKTLAEADCLNFQRQIQGVYKVLNGCDRVIYFVDGVNSDRVINIDDILRNPTSHSYLNNFGNFDCSLIKNKRDINLATIDNIVVNNSGGNLEVGTYQFILQYEDKYGNGTDYFGFTLPEPIVYGNYGGDYKNIIGGDPLLFPSTNKSISIQINDIDQKFKYINIIVGYTKNSITTYYVVEKTGIIGDSLDYTLSDITIDGTTTIVYDKLIVTTNPYDISETITQTDNRLIKGNLKGKFRNFSEFQRLATQITVNYVTKPIKHSSDNSTSTSGLSKSGTAYSDFRTYMRDEVYSKGIVWVFKDGTETPAFHIPGRILNTPNVGSSFPSSDPNTHSRPNNNTGVTDTGWDSALILAEDNSGNLLSDFKFLLPSEFVIIDNKRYCPRWKVYNTAYRRELNTVTDEWYSKGELAFYESEERYPVVKDCNDNYIYPIEDIDGRIVGQKIRHHKMPDTTLEEHFTLYNDTNYILPLGLEYANINVPTEYVDEVLGYYIVTEQRDQNNKTILDKGLLHQNELLSQIRINDGLWQRYNVQTVIGRRNPVEQGADYPIIPMFSSIDVECGNTDLFDKDTAILVPGCGDCPDGLDCFGAFPNYYCVDPDTSIRYTQKSHSFHGPVSKFYKSTFSSAYTKVERILNGTIGSFYENNDDIEISRGYYNILYNDSYIDAGEQTNLSLEKDPIYIDPNAEIPKGYLENTFLNANGQETVVFETIDLVNTADRDTDAFGDDGAVKSHYVSMKLYNRRLYGQVSLRKYYKSHNSIIDKLDNRTIQFGGDCFINKFSFFKSAFLKRCNGDDHSVDFETDKCLLTYFVESEINTELRHINIADVTSKDNTFWDYFNGTYKEFFELDWNGKDRNNDDSLGGTSAWFLNTYIKNKYLYNKDFSKSDSVKPYFSLDLSYEFCKECREEFPNRITYSEQGTQEQKADNYRIFLANNYRDLPANTGEITNLFINFDEMYASVKHSSPYKIITKPYQISTDQTTLYVGTGEFFSVPPRELISTEYGYAGSQCKWGTKSTEYGTVFVDDVTGKIFLLGEGLKELSLKGMRNWFEENIQINLNNQYKKIKGIDYPYNNQPALKNGIGFFTAYDPRHKRIIITKKDYECLNTNRFNDLEIMNVEDKTIFKDLSWTISYSFLQDSWVSWHSYLPNFYYNDSNNFYSSINTIPKTYRHDKYNFQTYYGVKKPYIIEYVLNKDSQITKTLDDVSYLSKVEELDIDRNYWIDKDYETFDNILVYNSYQSSGIKDIVSQRNSDPFITINSSDVIASKNEKTWKLNNLRDITIDRNKPLFTSRWSDIQTDYYIDKVPNQLVLDENKDAFELERFRDKYHIVRLYSNNSNNYKITTDLSTTLNNYSYR